MNRRQQMVMVTHDPERCRWQVSKGRRMMSSHYTQAVAVRTAKRIARRHHVELLVTNGRTGRIRSKDSYGPESPRRDRER